VKKRNSETEERDVAGWSVLINDELEEEERERLRDVIHIHDNININDNVNVHNEIHVHDDASIDDYVSVNDNVSVFEDLYDQNEPDIVNVHEVHEELGRRNDGKSNRIARNARVYANDADIAHDLQVRECRAGIRIAKNEWNDPSVRVAVMTEFDRWFETNAVSVPDESDDMSCVKPVPSYLHAEWKKGSGGELKAKGRVIVLGNQHKTSADTYAPTPESCILFTLLFLSLYLNFEFGFGDVKHRFLMHHLS